MDDPTNARFSVIETTYTLPSGRKAHIYRSYPGPGADYSQYRKIDEAGVMAFGNRHTQTKGTIAI